VQLVHEFTMQVTRTGSLPIGAGPFGTRTVGIVGGGVVTGERIAGEIVGPGADWAVFGADGYAHVDVRLQIRTHDDAHLFLRYEGSLRTTDEMMAALRTDGETAFGDTDWFVHARLESGAPQYAWVNRTLFVGQGRVVPGGVEYAFSRLA
jgi:hypothetical protein